jgi:hypothetical protein
MVEYYSYNEIGTMEGLMVKPSVFIGSSSEALDFPRAVQFQLKDNAELTIWNELPFKPGQFTLETIMNALDRFDFAVFVFSPDDMVLSRGVATPTARDNVVFELGLFMGRLGRSRAFVLQQANANIKMLSDLSGLTTVTYEWPNRENNPISAVGPACTMIRRAIKDLGVFDGNSKQLRQVKEEIKEQENKLSTQQEQIGLQSEILFQIVAFSMSFHIYAHLKEIYYKNKSGNIHEEYLYEDYHQRDIYFLRDHGYIESKSSDFLRVEHLYARQNLLQVIRLTPAGVFYVELREKLEREKPAGTEAGTKNIPG